MKEYNPIEHSVVQALMKPDGTNRYEVDDFVEALIFGLLKRLETCYWNWNQHQLQDRESWELLDVPGGFEYRRYNWGENEDECQRPNLKFKEVVVNWYKYPGRGMSTNVDYTEKEWRDWFDEAMKQIELYNSCGQLSHHEFRDKDAGRKPFSSDDRVQCKDCKYCVEFGANSLIWNRQGSRDVKDAE